MVVLHTECVMTVHSRDPIPRRRNIKCSGRVKAFLLKCKFPVQWPCVLVGWRTELGKSVWCKSFDLWSQCRSCYSLEAYISEWPLPKRASGASFAMGEPVSNSMLLLSRVLTQTQPGSLCPLCCYVSKHPSILLSQECSDEEVDQVDCGLCAVANVEGGRC